MKRYQYFLSLFLYSLSCWSQELPKATGDLPQSNIGETTYNKMLRSISDLDLSIRYGPLYDTHYGPLSRQKCGPKGSYDSFTEETLIQYSTPPKKDELIDIYMVRDSNDQSIVVAIAKINKSQFDNLMFEYRPTNENGTEGHSGVLSVGDVLTTSGRLVIGKDSVVFKADNDITIATLFDGEKVRITNFEGFSVDTEVEMSGSGGQFKILGRSGIAFDIRSGVNTPEIAKLKFDFGAGTSVQNQHPSMTFESVLKVQFNLD